MKKIFVLLFAFVFFFSGCASETVPSVTQPSPSVMPSATSPSEDAMAKDNLLPLHVNSDGVLFRVYLSNGKPHKKVITDNFSLHYGGEEISVIKFYREKNLLYYADNYSVKQGKVLCNLNSYKDLHPVHSHQNILAKSVTFGTDSVAYISVESGKNELYRCDASGNTVLVDSGVSEDIAYVSGNDLVYLKNGILYYESQNGQPVELGKSGRILQSGNGMVITLASNNVSLASLADVKVFFPNQQTNYVLKQALVNPEVCVNGYIISNGNLYSIQPQGAQYISQAQYVLPVQGGNGIIFYDGENAVHCINGMVTAYSLTEPPVDAYYARGRLIIRTAQWLYDGQSKIGDPDQVFFLGGELYMSYNNSDGITATLRKLDGIAPVVTNALANMPIYSVGGRICYFVRQSFTSELYRLASGDTRFDQICPYMPVYGNSALNQLAAYSSPTTAVIIASGVRLEFEDAKIYL